MSEDICEVCDRRRADHTEEEAARCIVKLVEELAPYPVDFVGP